MAVKYLVFAFEDASGLLQQSFDSFDSAWLHAAECLNRGGLGKVLHASSTLCYETVTAFEGMARVWTVGR